MRVFRLFQSMLVAVVLAPGALAAPQFQSLGFLPGGNASNGWGVSPDGSVAFGRSRFSPTLYDMQAFKWQGGIMTGLGDLPGGSTSSVAQDSTPSGGVIVGWGTGAAGQEAFRWSGGVMTGLGTLPGAASSEATGVSSDGSKVVGVSSYTGGFCSPVLWQDGTMIDLGRAVPGYYRTWATDISSDGSIIVGWANDFSHTLAWYWQNGTMSVLPGNTQTVGCSADAISHDGRTIIGSRISGSNVEACLWRDNTLVGLGDLPGGMFRSDAKAVSADGSIVVGVGRVAETPYGSTAAFIWDQVHGIRDLRNVLISETQLDLTGWWLTEATGVSHDGLTIVGSGIDPAGRPAGWIVRLPEPATLVLICIGILLSRRN